MYKIKRRFSIIATIIFITAISILGIFAVSNRPVEAAQKKQTIEAEIANITEQKAIHTKQVLYKSSDEQRYYDVPLSNDLQIYIKNICESYGVPEDVVIALIGVESGYKQSVISKTNDYGYMQINSCNHDTLKQQLNISDVLDPYDNIHCGVYMLSELYKKYSDTTQVLMCYNCGETGAKRLWKKGINSTSYTDKVELAIENLKIKGENK
ncbi:MAG: transglycosylase SLT domain-containing protein [Oscillospiraceae bacterium]